MQETGEGDLQGILLVAPRWSLDSLDSASGSINTDCFCRLYQHFLPTKGSNCFMKRHSQQVNEDWLDNNGRNDQIVKWFTSWFLSCLCTFCRVQLGGGKNNHWRPFERMSCCCTASFTLMNLYWLGDFILYHYLHVWVSKIKIAKTVLILY